MQRNYRWVLLAVLWLVAANLRMSHIGVSPVLPLVRADLGLSYSAAGLLMVIPIAMMCLFAVPGGILVDRLGARRAVTIGLMLLSVGSLLRAWANSPLEIFAYTILFGAGIGLAHPGLPGMVKDWFPDRAGMASGIYTNGFHVGVLFTTAITGSVLLRYLDSWRGTFLFWGGLSSLILLCWLFLGRDRPDTGPKRRTAHPLAAWTDRVAWLASGFFMLNITLYFAFMSWLPSYYHDLGWSLETAAYPLVVVNFTSVVASLLASWISDRTGSRRKVILNVTVLAVIGTIGFFLFPLQVPWLWAILTGLGLSGPFAISLALPVDLARPGEVGSMAGFMLTMGYFGAMIAPLAVGVLRDLLGSFSGGMMLIMILAVLTVVAAYILPEGRVTPEGRKSDVARTP